MCSTGDVSLTLHKQAANLEKNVQTANNYSSKEVACLMHDVYCCEMLPNDRFVVEIVNLFTIFAKISI